ncbi:MAG: pseudouridine synthase [Planctomycetota bacterium]|nr:pseudouridine synthase [Planctomycetota bacterium]
MAARKNKPAAPGGAKSPKPRVSGRKPVVAKGAARKPKAGPGRPARAGAGGRRPAAAKPKRAPIRVTAEAGAPVVEDGLVRINRFLAAAGLASRRAAEELIEAGRVTVNGEVVTELGTRVDPANDDVRVDDQRLKKEPPVYILFNKPKGVVCTNARQEQRPRVVDHLPDVRGRVYTVGRLDAESEGLILVTNDGDFAQRIAHPRYELAKTYAVLIRGKIDDSELQKARGGVWLAEGKTSGARILVERRGRDRTYLKVSLKEGRNREIRRIFARLGYPVLSLKRVRIGQLTLHGLGAGRYRFLRPEEVSALVDLTRRGGGDEA